MKKRERCNEVEMVSPGAIVRWKQRAQASPRFQHSMALAQDIWKILNMLEDVIAQDQIEAFSLERKMFAKADCKRDPVLVAQVANGLPGHGCAQGRDVQANN